MALDKRLLLGLWICVGRVFFKAVLIGSEKFQAGGVGENAASRSFSRFGYKPISLGGVASRKNRRRVMEHEEKETRA
jgi:hypothetical protein